MRHARLRAIGCHRQNLDVTAITQTGNRESPAYSRKRERAAAACDEGTWLIPWLRLRHTRIHLVLRALSSLTFLK